MCQISDVPKEASITFRLPADLKGKILDISRDTDRSLSNTVLWLLRRGIEAYEADGYLVDTKPFSVKVPIRDILTDEGSLARKRKAK